MASYLSKPTEYAPYQPTIDAELYGKMLMKKEADYQEGIKKTQSDINYLGSLPVGNDADRQYLQGIIHGITTEINNNVNTNWSDQSIQNITHDHISKLANDYIVQTATKSALQWKSDKQKAIKSQEENEGKDIANQYNLAKTSNPYLNAEKAGTAYKGSWIPFVDINEVRTKVAKDVPVEEWTQSDTKGLGTMQYADIVNQNFKARKPDKIRDSLIGYIDTNPGAKTQLVLEADYAYKDYDKAATVNELYNAKLKNLSHYQLQLNQNNKDLTSLGDLSNPAVVKKRAQLEKERKILEGNYKKEALDIYQNVNNEVESIWEDENKRSGLFNNLYKEKWIQQAIDNYSFNDSQGITIQGQTAFQKQMAFAQGSRDQQRLDSELKKALAEKTASKENEYGIIIPQGIASDKANSSYAKATDIVQKKDEQISRNSLNLLYNVFSVNGGFEGLEKDYDGKTVKITRPYTAVNVPGVGVQNLPTQVFLVGGEYTDSKGKKRTYDGMLNQFINSYRNGEYKNTNKLSAQGGAFTIGDANIKDIQKISEDLYGQADKKHLIATIEKQVYKKLNIPNLVDNLSSNPINGVSGKDVIKYNSLPQSILDDYHEAYEKGVYDPKDRSEYEFKNKLKEQVSKSLIEYGLDPSKIYNIKYATSGIIKEIKDKTKDAAVELNKAFESKNLITTPLIREWTGDKDELHKLSREDVQNSRARAIKTFAQTFVSQPGADAKLIGDAQKIVSFYEDKQKGKVDDYPTLHYTQDSDTKEYILTVEKGGEQANLPVTQDQAKLWKWDPTIGEVSDLEQTIRWNRYGSTIPTNPSSGKPEVMSFENARHIGTLGNKELRYHVVPRNSYSGQTEYTVYFYDKEVDSSKEPEVKVQPVPDNDLNRLGQSIELHKEQIQQQNKRK